MARAKKEARLRNADYNIVRHCYQQAYFNSDNLAESFWCFCRDISGRGSDGLEKDGRWEFAKFVTDAHPYKMLQAARGSWKSSMAIVDYAAWRVGREAILTWDEEKGYGESTMRILMASEVLTLARRNVQGVRQIMEWRERYIELCGEHRPPDKKIQTWGRDMLVSRYRSDSRILEGTITPMGINSERVGFHYDLLLLDDLEAERGSATKDQIENCWTLFRLLLSIMQRGGEMLIVGTRWHDEDIYQKIEDQNARLPRSKKFKILKIPSDDGTTDEIGKLNFPKILPKHELEDLRRKQGTSIWYSQYRLIPMAEEEKLLKRQWLQFVQPHHLRKEGLNFYTTADFAWTEVTDNFRRKKRDPDWTVIMTVAVDEVWNYYVIDWFRERCSKRTAVKELYRQYFAHKAILAPLQRWDRTQIADMIDQYGFEYGKLMVPEWVNYMPDKKKTVRIETILAPLFEAEKIFLLPDMEWFIQDEYDPFPKSKHFDALDCIANVAHIASPARKIIVKPNLTPDQLRIKRLKAGTFDPDGGASSDWTNI